MEVAFNKSNSLTTLMTMFTVITYYSNEICGTKNMQKIKKV